MIALADPVSARSSNLAVALIGLPAGRRADAMVFFRFCRMVDDIADDPASSVADKVAHLEEWHRALDTAQGLPAELARVIDAHGLDRGLLRAVVEGCLRDAGMVRLETIEELRGYCWQVACAVGLVSAKIFGCHSPGASAFAVHLGYALQFTNICRDVGEDADMDRIYIPREILSRHSVDAADVIERRDSAGLRGAVGELADMARHEFGLARRAFPVEDSNGFRPACIMAAIYWRVLQRIERPDHEIFGKRARLTTLEKSILIAVGLVVSPARLLPITDTEPADKIPNSAVKTGL